MTCNDWNEPCCPDCINQEQTIEGASRCDCKGCQAIVDDVIDIMVDEEWDVQKIVEQFATEDEKI